MRRNAVLLALAIGASLGISGCANTATSGDSIAQEAASADRAETFCQTDEDTGSRLAHRTTCANTNSTDAQQAGRAMQKGGLMGN